MTGENFPPELLDAMRELTDVLRENTRSKAIDYDKVADSSNKAASSLSSLGQVTNEVTAEQRAAKRAADQAKEAENHRKLAQYNATESLKKFGAAVLSTEENLGKYGNALSSAGDAIFEFGKSMGPLGAVIGGLLKGFTSLAAAYLDQTDKVLKASDQLSKIGGAGGKTADQLLDMAHAAGLSSKNLNLLVKPMQSLGTKLLAVGSNAEEGMNAFGKMAAVTSEQYKAMQRLGVSQEELLQSQADYIALQSASGRSIKHELKDRDSLQRASIEYTENLLTLAKISGEDVNNIKQKQREAMRDRQFQIQQIDLENKARQALASGDKETASRLRAQAKSAQEAMKYLAASGDTEMSKGLKSFLTTGTMAAEETQSLVRLGLGPAMEEFKKTVEAGGDSQMAAAKFQDEYNEKLLQGVSRVGQAGALNERMAKKFNQNVESMENAQNRRDINHVKELENANKAIKDKQKPGVDPRQDLRAAQLETERKLKIAMDKLIGSTTLLTIGMVALGGAAAAATLALGKMALTAGLGGGGGNILKGLGDLLGKGKLGGALKTGAGAAASAAKTGLGAAAKMATPLIQTAASRAPVIGAVVGAGLAAKGAYNEYQDVAEKEKAGQLSAVEAKEKKTEAVGGGIGATAGAAGGALALGAKGATMGLALGPLGAAVGGIIGAGLGAWLGTKGGDVIGRTAAKGINLMGEKADKKTAEAAKKIEDRAKEEEALLLTPKDAVQGNLKGVNLDPKEVDRKVQELLKSYPKSMQSDVGLLRDLREEAEMSLKRDRLGDASKLSIKEPADLKDPTQLPVAKTKDEGIPGGVKGALFGGLIAGPIGAAIGGVIGSKFTDSLDKKSDPNLKAADSIKKYYASLKEKTGKQTDEKDVGLEKDGIKVIQGTTPWIVEFKSGLAVDALKQLASPLSARNRLQGDSIFEKAGMDIRKFFGVGRKDIESSKEAQAIVKLGAQLQSLDSLKGDKKTFGDVDPKLAAKQEKMRTEFESGIKKLVSKGWDENTLRGQNSGFHTLQNKLRGQFGLKLKEDQGMEGTGFISQNQKSAKAQFDELAKIASRYKDDDIDVKTAESTGIDPNLSILANNKLFAKEPVNGEELEIEENYDKLLKSLNFTLQSVNINFSKFNKNIKDSIELQEKGLTEKADSGVLGNIANTITNAFSRAQPGPTAAPPKAPATTAAPTAAQPTPSAATPSAPSTAAGTQAQPTPSTSGGFLSGILGGITGASTPSAPSGPGAVPPATKGAEKDPDAKEEVAGKADKKQPTSAKPKNVTIQQTADVSGVDPSLLSNFYAAAEEFGRGISINSAYRGDKKQAELWVRGRILREPGIFTPAAPKNDTTIEYKGQTYNVKGSGRGSSHGNGQALDISADYASLDPILSKYGLHRPYRGNDPPHVEKIKASEGGIATGPETGYPATLHGREMIVPLEPNSILEKISKATSATSEGVQAMMPDPTKAAGTDNNMIREMVNANVEMYNLLSEKLDAVISTLGEGNNTNKKLLKSQMI